jgi:hypothetical protein
VLFYVFGVYAGRYFIEAAKIIVYRKARAFLGKYVLGVHKLDKLAYIMWVQPYIFWFFTGLNKTTSLPRSHARNLKKKANQFG